jgi:Icc-related predicted phosphoesterase
MRIYYTTDIHGSTLCFKKFLNCGKFYSADAAIVGGDVTGKLIIPIVEKADGTYSCKHQGTQYDLKTKEEMEALRKKIEDQGYYPFLANDKDMDEFAKDKTKVDELFEKLILKRVEEWVELADERLKDKKFDCYFQPGNDDRYEIDPILEKSKTMINPEGKLIQLDKDHEMINMGHANITPWDCPRDEPEEKLAERIDKMASQVKNMKNCIFNFHCPPYDTNLDVAPKLDKNLKPIIIATGVETIHVGSVAVRKAIDRYQPLLGLHGHIHESKAVQSLNRTLALNPGSEYGEGVLRGALIELNEKKIRNHAFVQG